MADRRGKASLLVSLYPRFAEGILAGAKKVEFRRKAPRRVVCELLLYATAPVRRVVGFARVSAVVQDTPEELWRQFHAHAGMDLHEFLAYFEGAQQGTAFVIGAAERWSPEDLPEELRAVKPPQSYAYWETDLAQPALPELVHVVDKAGGAPASRG